MTRAQVHRLANGRLHLNDGPIDLIISAEGPSVARAEDAAVARFEGVLDELCAELPVLRTHLGPKPEGPTARRMWTAVAPYASQTFITPMAAVAGSVAEDILRHMTEAAPLTRAFVNNGGDIALHLAPGQSYRAGLVNRPDQPALFAEAEITAASPVRGIATSGWRGRSFSLGIADAVTVLARSASAADAAATIIANAVDCPGHPGIERQPASALQPDNDLGHRLVTVAVTGLTPAHVDDASDAGEAVARGLLRQGLITACALHLAGATRTLGTYALKSATETADA